MTFREFNAKYLEPGFMWLMILGVVALCQPWNALLHAYSVTITLVGLIGFTFAVHVPAPAAERDENG
jgi:hypothetical protein